MRRTVMMMMAAATMACSGVMAADAPGAPNTDNQVDKVGALRGRMMLKFSTELPKFNAGNASEAQAVYNAIAKIYGEVNQVAQKAIQVENAKAEARDQATIDNYTKKYQKNQEMWGAFNQKEWANYGKKVGELNACFAALNQVYATIYNLDGYWNNGGLDLGVLADLFSMMNKKADDYKIQAQLVLSDATKQVAVWEAFAKE